MNISVSKKITLFIAVLAVFFFTAHMVSAQGVGGKGTAGPKGPTVTPGNAPPVVTPPPQPKGTTTAEMDRARKHRREKHERAKENEPKDPSTSNTPLNMPPFVPAPWVLDFRHLGDNDLKVVSTQWKTERRFGEKPFTLITIKVNNLTPNYLCILDLLLEGTLVERLDIYDDRPLPAFPLKLQRFPDLDHRLMAPIPPLAQQTLTFTLPAALKSTAKLDAKAASYVKFQTPIVRNWNPVQVVGFEAQTTETEGKNHMGILLTLENEASHPVGARVRVDLGELASPGGNTYFFKEAFLEARERKSFVIRSIPDEGIPPKDPARETMPAHFRVKRVSITDVRF